MSNKDLADTLVQANETISKNNEMISKLERKDEKNRMALTHGSITYDAMITQKHSDIVKLQDENQLLRDQLEEVEIKLAQSNETIVLLKREIDNMTAINVLQISLSGLDLDKERLSAKVDCLKNEIASYQNSTACVESRLQTLLHGNETLMVDIKILKSTNDQLLHPSGDTVMSTLKEALYVLPKKIYETIVHFQSEIKECDKETEGVFVEYLNKEVVEIEEINKKEKQQKKIYADKTCQQDEDLLNSIAEEVNSNFKNAAHKLKFLEGQYEEKLQEIKNLMDDVKQRDQEIKILQEYITYLLQKNNVLQTKVKCQIKEYQNKLTLQKKKYDSSLNAFRKEYNENVERLEARFKDIKYEKSSFDTENWLQSLNLKELSELHNRINILSSHAARNTESNAERIETKNSQEHRFYNKFTLRKQHPNKNRPSSKKKTSKEEFYSKYFNVENNKIAITELYCKDSKLERKHSSSVNEKKLPGNTESPKPKTNRSLDWQREKFIYQCSMHYKLNNAR
ncbi:hypothetical protein PUN28_001543 [Cardiocondyla obscurior]|uniref:Uncharacterized protein n=1 Tax=Cardiocondyla obscurior TaxID=286306 RepID=A0AAW2H5K1_9HYME